MTALLEFFGSSTAQPVDSGDTGISGDSGSLLKAQFLMLEVLVVEAVEKEIQKIWYDCFGSFIFQKLYKVVVCSWKEFDKNLSDNADTRLLYIC